MASGLDSKAPKLADYQEAPALIPAVPVRAQPGCRRYLIFLVVLALCVLVGGIFLWPANRPVVSGPVSGVTSVSRSSTATVSGPQVVSSPGGFSEIRFATIHGDGTVHIYDRLGKELIISLASKNWERVTISPQGDYVALLSKAATNDRNLELYELASASWRKVTVYDESTTGITGYAWVDNERVLYTQGGWLHQYDTVQRELKKIAQVDAELVSFSGVHKQLLLRRAVISQVSGQQHSDNVFLITDLNGTPVNTFVRSQFTAQPANYMLASVHFTALPAIYVVELQNFPPQKSESGAVLIAKLFVYSDKQGTEVSLPADYNYEMIGSYHDRLLVNVIERATQQLLTLGQVDLAANKLNLVAFPPPLSSRQRLKDATIIASYNSQTLLSYESLERVGDTEAIVYNWFTLDPSRKLLIPVSISARVREIAHK